MVAKVEVFVSAYFISMFLHISELVTTLMTELCL